MLRIKAFKALYSSVEDRDMTLKATEALFKASCEAVRDLYLFMLSIIPVLAEAEAKRLDLLRRKFSPTEEDLNPNVKFASNSVAAVLSQDPDLRKLLSRKKLSWEQYDIVVSKILSSVHTKTYFKRYMALEESTLKDDCKILEKIFEQELVDMPEVEDLIEEKNISWTDELAYALTWCCYTMEDLSRGESWRLPALYQSEMVLRRKPGASVSSDRDFARRLLSAAFSGYEGYFNKVVSMTSEWEPDRLFSADMAIIALCLAEMDTFSDIPPRVSLNEWIEISKWYSSPKSSQFVNGILDKVMKEKEAEAK